MSRIALGIALAGWAALLSNPACAQAQYWDPGKQVADTLAQETGGRLALRFESRVRLEDRRGNGFGKEPDRAYALYRNRLSLSFAPMSWLRVSGMVQDSRVPGYGPGAPNTLRDSADLHEAYIELFPDQRNGFWLSAGRAMLNYGEARLIGVPQWSNVSRTYDHVRAAYKNRRVRVEALIVSPVKVRSLDFNYPNPGERIWGVYSSFPDLKGKHLLEAYALRHDQNRIGGFTGGSKAAGTDRLGTNTAGFRLAGPLAAKWSYSVENAWQNGKTGAAEQRAMGWFSGASRRWMAGKRPLDVSGEYKFASRTFDQLSPANHDKFGHQDLIGWRNLHNARSLATLGLTKVLAVNVMYDAYWIASAREGLYSGSGRLILRSANGSAGRYVGQEADAFVTCKLGPYLLGAGYGYFFSGGVVRKTTPGAAPTYLYGAVSYSF